MKQLLAIVCFFILIASLPANAQGADINSAKKNHRNTHQQLIEQDKLIAEKEKDPNRFAEQKARRLKAKQARKEKKAARQARRKDKKTKEN